jgi:hypothetical protein
LSKNVLGKLSEVKMKLNYVTTIRNNAYFQWQIELLIQSFKEHGIEDQLFIGILDEEEQKPENVFSEPRNLINHKNTFKFNKFTNENLTANHIHGINEALKQGIIKQPFVSIHADSILYKPISLENDFDAIFSGDYFFLEQMNKDNIDISEHLKRISKLKSQFSKQEINLKPMPLGSVYVFNKMPLEFFDRVLNYIKALYNEYGDKYTDRIAWMLSFYDYLGGVNYKSTWDYEMTMLDHERESNIIHYSKGLPPVFNKIMFYKNNNDLCTAEGNPYKVLLEHNTTTVTNYIQKIVKSYKNGN